MASPVVMQAVVCVTKTWHRPSRAPACETNCCTRSVMSITCLSRFVEIVMVVVGITLLQSFLGLWLRLACRWLRLVRMRALHLVARVRLVILATLQGFGQAGHLVGAARVVVVGVPITA